MRAVVDSCVVLVLDLCLVGHLCFNMVAELKIIWGLKRNERV